MWTLLIALLLAAPQEPEAPEILEREHAALAAYERFTREQRPPEDASAEQVAERGRSLRAKLAAFAAEWPATAASYRARIDAAGLDLHLLQQPEPGLALLAEVYAEMQARQAPLPPPARLTVGRVGIQYAEELGRLERFDAAEAVLRELAAAGGPEQTRAEGLIATLALRRRVAVGQPLPAFRATALDGREIAAEDYRGRVLLLDFWATWCGPCKAEAPQLAQLQQEHGERGLALLGFALDGAGAAESIRKFVQRYEWSWPQVHDGARGAEGLAHQFALPSIPATFLIDRRGIIRHRDLRGGDLQAAVAALLAEP